MATHVVVVVVVLLLAVVVTSFRFTNAFSFSQPIVVKFHIQIGDNIIIN